jgi:hypothetical protein
LLCALTALPSPAGAGAPGETRELAAAGAGEQGSRLRAQRVAAVRRALTRRILDADARRRYWLRVMHRPLPSQSRLPWLPLAELERAADWRAERAAELAREARNPPHLAHWRCIQRHETAAPYPAWRTASGNGYYGGLQLDRGFQITYGRWLYRSKGTADKWTPLEQIWTAEFAHSSGRGFAPWPRTARACGVL